MGRIGSFLGVNMGSVEGARRGSALEGVKMGDFWVKTKRYSEYII